MRGGLERWKRGVDSHGVRQAIAYALDGRCDSHTRVTAGIAALSGYSDTATASVTRWTAEDGRLAAGELSEAQLRLWVDGCDPDTGARRGRELSAPTADLVLDGAINAPKSFSIAAMLHPALGAAYEELQDRLRDRIILTWQTELNARRGAGGRIREPLQRLEVVELQHRRSRALDPHVHRHLWLSVKVQGRDSRWSNVDSRVAMRLHTLINAEGDLAARTDPAWITALAAHGYTLDVNGEIAQLAHLVRPLSRRSNQIEANRSVLLAEWEAAHPGRRADAPTLRQIDRQAWALHRPDKPTGLDERDWEQLVKDELSDIDPDLVLRCAAIVPTVMPIADLDRRLLAARAVVDADARSLSASGRFSVVDIRAGAVRAVAASGVVAHRATLDELIDDIVGRAIRTTLELTAARNVPTHVKNLMAARTAALKQDLAARLEDLANDTSGAVDAEVAGAADQLSATGVPLADDQIDAAAALAGSHRLVTVTGPAGSGKTTMLRLARAALATQHRRMLIVAPTRKAAAVAAREVEVAATSVHALLMDHGWRWAQDDTGAERWTRLRPGATDHGTGCVYLGPRQWNLRQHDRVVVDEAGMLDLEAAHALCVVIAETGADLAVVGDDLQAAPVGHGGAMEMMRRRGRAVELTGVHRFADPDYAKLTERLRHPADATDAADIARALSDSGRLTRVDDHAAAHAAMVDAYCKWTARRQRVALVVATNNEADAINEVIQRERVARGELQPDGRAATGMASQRILEGDVVQTRRNDRIAGVDNRALWIVAGINADGITLTSLTDSTGRSRVSSAYASEHLQLAYASTVHGIQGETTDAAIVGPGVDAAGLYVGMTRGRVHNEAIAVAATESLAIVAVADSMLRGRREITLSDARMAACAELNRASIAPVASRRTGDQHLAATSVQLKALERWLDTAGEMLRTLMQHGADVEAINHARSLAPAEGRQTAPRIESLRQRMNEQARLRGLLERNYAHLVRTDGWVDPEQIYASVPDDGPVNHANTRPQLSGSTRAL